MLAAPSAKASLSPGSGEVTLTGWTIPGERSLGREMPAGQLASINVAEARTAGIRKLSLETGSQAMFAPARGLYLKAGFVECAPFADYTLDPNSVFMTRDLA